MRLALIGAALLMTACFRPRPAYNSSVESINCVAIQGWALDWNRLTIATEIGLYDGDKLIQKITANIPRPDLNSASKNHGFLLSPVPAVLFDHKPHTIHLRYGDSRTDLRQSPKTLQCPDH